MADTVTLDGLQYDFGSAFLLLSLDQRRKILLDMQRESARRGVDFSSDIRALAIASECWLRGFESSQSFTEVLRRARAGWQNCPDNRHIAVRLIYDRMYEGSEPRNVHGFRQLHLDVIERELKANSSPHEVACAVWRIERRRARRAGTDPPHISSRPSLHLIHNRLPSGVTPSFLVHAFRPYEPLVVMGFRAYPVSEAWLVLPRESVQVFTNDVYDWMHKYWPEALEACNTDDQILGYGLDRMNVVLAAEAYARGYVLEEAASFIFDQRVREVAV